MPAKYLPMNVLCVYVGVQNQLCQLESHLDIIVITYIVITYRLLHTSSVFFQRCKVGKWAQVSFPNGNKKMLMILQSNNRV